MDELTFEMMTQEFELSHGSIRNLFVHIISVDESWFSGLLGLERPEFLDPSIFRSVGSIQEKWDDVELKMREYLEGISDAKLKEPFIEGLDRWQVLFHIVNHGTHHRAQIFTMLNQMGITSNPQDFALFVLGRI